MAKKDKNEAPEVEQTEAVELPLLETEIGQAFVSGADNGDSEDVIKMSMIQAGSTFKTVTRQYNELMVETGRAATAERKAELVEAAVADNDVSTEEGFAAAIAVITSAEESIDDKSAAASIRGYGRKNDLEVYKKPKSAGAGKAGFASDFYAFLQAGARTEDEARAFIQGTDGNKETSDNVKRHESHYMAIHNLTQAIRAA